FADHLAVALRLRIDVDRDQLVGAVAQPFDAERPDVDVILLALDELRDVRRIAGFIGMCDADGADACKNEPSHDILPGLGPRLCYTLRNTLIHKRPQTDFASVMRPSRTISIAASKPTAIVSTNSPVPSMPSGRRTRSRCTLSSTPS